MRSILPSIAIWWAFILLELLVARVLWPGIDTNGWPFILVAFPISGVVLAMAGAVTHVFLIRWLLRYRTRRKGRPVALRSVLGPTDGNPSRLRRWKLAMYGVSRHEQELLRSL